MVAHHLFCESAHDMPVGSEELPPQWGVALETSHVGVKMLITAVVASLFCRTCRAYFSGVHVPHSTWSAFARTQMGWATATGDTRPACVRSQAILSVIYGRRERAVLQSFFDKMTRLRMNHSHIRPGGVAADLPDGWRDDVKVICEMIQSDGRVRRPRPARGYTPSRPALIRHTRPRQRSSER